MKKIMLVMIAILLLNLSLAGAITQQEAKEAKSLIDSKANCKSLSDSQLELIGEYYMEQMHKGESHELMHQMMGMKEGSEIEEQFHINLAKAMYCGEKNALGGMMNGGMMSMMGSRFGTNMMGQGMMGNYGYGFGYWSFVNVLYVILLIGLIILVWLWIIKLWKGINSKESKK